MTTFHDSPLLKESGSHGDYSRPLHTTFRLQVIPDNGQPMFASQLSVWGTDADHLQPGRWTYVLYDSDHPDRCELDKDRLSKEFEPLYSGRHRVMVPKEVSDAWFASTAAAAENPAQSEPPAASDPMVADLSRLADLHAAGTLSDAEFAEAKADLLERRRPQ